MEHISEIITVVQQQKNLQEFVPTTLSKPDKHELSIYKTGTISPEVLASGIKTIANAFPDLPKGWYDVLKDMMKNEGFNDRRFSDAVKNLVKNCIYPKPTIANVLSFDKTVKAFTYDELLKATNDYSPESRRNYLMMYDKVNYYGEMRYCRKEEITRYELPKWEN